MMSFQASIGSTKSSFVAFKKESLSSIQYNLRIVKIAKNEQKWRNSRNGITNVREEGYSPEFTGILIIVC